MGIAYLILFAGYLLVSVVLVWLVKKIFKRRRLTILTVAFVILFPTYDSIIQLTLLGYYAVTRQPLQKIIRTVDTPGSVFWEDNAWPGYDENYRLWMIDHLLDGKHLDTLAMNGPDGKIYLYRYGQGDTPEIYNDAAALPKLNYHVALNPVRLWFWEKPFVWADRIEIIDNRTNELIAYSERYMGYAPRMFVIRALGPGYPFEGGAYIGDDFVYYFDHKVIFNAFKFDISPPVNRSDFVRRTLKYKMKDYVKNRRKGE